MHDAVVSLALRFPRFSLCVFDSCETSWFIDIMGQENAHFSHHLSAVNRKLHRLHRLCVWLSLHRKSSQFQWTAHKSRHFHRSREMQATQKSFMLETQLGCECIISVKWWSRPTAAPSQCCSYAKNRSAVNSRRRFFNNISFFSYWLTMICRYLSETTRLAAHSNTNI